MSTTNTLDLPKTSKNGKIKAKRIAIQGYPGAFHEMAARHYFDGTPVEIIPADTFQEVVQLVEDPEMADVGLMAIENTLAGGMLPNHKLVNNSGLHITGEIYLRVVQNLMVLPGQKIEDITEVHSHYMAIRQCRKYFAQYPHIRLVESLDTALSAKEIRDGKLKNRGAIASNLAAEMYELDILGPSIETNKQNYTRFLVLQHQYFSGNDAQKVDKASISFTTSHDAGSLNKVLSVLAAYEINLSKIQSVPIEGRHWEYMFFVDLTAKSAMRLDQVLNAIRPICNNLKVLGLYERGRHV
ncbi:MAG: prephenate dehydratase [Saprospiraceae bacterium]